MAEPELLLGKCLTKSRRLVYPLRWLISGCSGNLLVNSRLSTRARICRLGTLCKLKVEWYLIGIIFVEPSRAWEFRAIWGDVSVLSGSLSQELIKALPPAG